MVERFHRQLKVAIKACDNSNRLSEIIPLILLAIRTTPKIEFNCSPAEMVFGKCLTLPGELISISTNDKIPDSANFADRLKDHMGNLQPFCFMIYIFK